MIRPTDPADSSDRARARAASSARATIRCSIRTARSSRATTSTSRFTQERHARLLACYKLFGGDDEIGPWGCGNAEITFRNSLMPVPVSEYEPLVLPGPPGPARTPTERRCAWPRLQLGRPLQRRLAQGRGADGRRLHRGVARSVLQVRLLPHRAAHLRPPGRRDAGGAPLLREPLEHLEGDDLEGHRRQAADGHGDTRSASRSRSARRARSPTT